MKVNRCLSASAAAILAVSTGGASAEAADPPREAARDAGAGALALPTQELPQGVSYVRTVEGIAEYSLANGMRVLLFPDPSKQTATVNVTYLVGSRHEGYGETGMAHLLEHLLFRGSKNHPKTKDELTSHGCRPNGSTWYDRTNYFETFAASDSNLAWAIDLEADRMVNSFISQADLNSEMTVVRNEFEVGENSPRDVLSDRLLSTAYLWHNYGKSTIGSRADIERVPITRLQAFYRTWYQPDNAVLVVAGKFDPNRALALVGEKFGAIPRPGRTLPTTYTEEPAQDGERAVELRRVGDVQVAGLGYHVPAGPDPQFPAVAVLGQILGDTPSGRLYKSLVETRKAVSAGAWAMQFHDPGMLLLTCDVRKEQSLEEVRDEMIRVAEGAGATAPTQEEVERARQALLREWELRMRNSERAAIGLSEWAAMGDWRLLFLHRDRLKQVTPADVQRAASEYLRSTNRTVALFHPTEKPDRAAVPPTPDVAGMLKDFKGGEGVTWGEEFDPSPLAVEERVTRSTLPSGLKLVLLPRKTRASSVQVFCNLHFGDEGSLKGQAMAGELAGSMLLRGTKNRTRQQIQDEVDRLNARFDVSGQATGAQVQLEVTRGNLPDALRLMADVLRNPAFAASELELLKRERVAAHEEEKTDPRTLAFTTLQRHLGPWPREDVRYMATPEEKIADVEATTLEQVSRFHQEFYGASAGEVAVVGDFDAAELTSLVSELLGDWKSQRPYTRIRTPFRAAPRLHQLVQTPDKESAVFNAALKIELQDTDPDYPAMLLGNFMTGGGFLNSRLAQRIREKDGLSYGVGSFFFASAFDKVARFGSFAICAPQNADRLEAAFRDELQKIIKDGFTADEIERAKDGWLQQRQVSRSRDGELARQLAQRAEEDRTLAWDARVEKTVSELTSEQILAAIRRNFDLQKISVVMAGDFAKVEKAEAQQTPVVTPASAK